MKASALLSFLVLVIVGICIFSSWYVVESGHVAVTKTLGTVEMDEVPAGLNWKLPLLTTAYEFSAKKIAARDAEIEIARARGIAEANAIINSSLTPGYQHPETEINRASVRV